MFPANNEYEGLLLCYLNSREVLTTLPYQIDHLPGIDKHILHKQQHVTIQGNRGIWAIGGYKNVKQYAKS